MKERLGAAAYHSLVEETLLHAGNNARLRAALSQPQLTFAFLGGSITAGCSCNQRLSTCYPLLLAEHLQKEFPNRMICCENYAQASMAALHGLLQTEQYLRQRQPDVIVVEYAVNESCDAKGEDHFESLVHKLLQLPKQPAVLLLTLMMENGYSCEPYILEIGRTYGLPVVGCQAVFKKAIAEGTLLWQDYSDDESHANLAGHGFLADCLLHCIRRACDVPADAGFSLPIHPRYSASLAQVRLLDFSDFTLLETDFIREIKENVICLCNTASAKRHEIRFQLPYHNLIFLYQQNNLPSFGALRICVDGKPCGYLKGKSLFSWGNTVAALFPAPDTGTTHEIVLRMAEGDAKKQFRLFAIAWC